MSLEQALTDAAEHAARLEAEVAEVKGRQSRIEVQWLQVQGELLEGQRRIEDQLKNLVTLLRVFVKGQPGRTSSNGEVAGG